MSVPSSRPLSIVHIGLDEAGSLTSEMPVFVVAAVVAVRPDTLHNLIRRAALRSGKRLERRAKNASELKWSNTSRRIRNAALAELAKADVELFALTVDKGNRRIEDTPENYGILVCELLSHCWHVYPDVALALDRHFASPAQIATVDTLIHRRWPAQGVLSIAHVDSRRSTLVQVADMVAGSVYSWHKEGDETMRLIAGNLGANLVEDWRHIKARWRGIA